MNERSHDPRTRLAEAPLGAGQKVVIAIAVALMGLDGFDVLAISFASPGIAAEWHIDRAALGIVLTMELVGMGLGAFVLGAVADRLGRRPLALACLALMSAGMLLASAATSVVSLCAWRIVTGVGIGGLLATATALAAEFSNDRHRPIAIAWAVIGYPIGAVVLGYVATELLKSHDWRSVFQFGAAVTALMLPVVWWRVPESVHWLCQAQPPDALARVNATLDRLGHGRVDALPAATITSTSATSTLFSPALVTTTVLVTLACFLHMMTFYFILKWVPKIVADMGFAASLAGKVLVWANLGGAVGGALFGWLATRVALRPLTIVVMIVGGFMVILFGHGQADLVELSWICAISGFFTNAGIVGLYSMLAQYFPTQLRATGTGFGIGVGRGGAALAPVLAGYLFASGVSLQRVAIVMALGSFLAALTLLGLRSSRANQFGGV